MRLDRIKRHFFCYHKDLCGRSKEYFRRLQRGHRKDSAETSDADLQAFTYDIARLIAVKGKDHSISETIVKPVLHCFMQRVLKRPPAILTNLPISRSTIGRRIDEMAEDVKRQLAEILRQTHFAVQLDESVIGDDAVDSFGIMILA